MKTVQLKLAALEEVGIQRNILILSDHFQVRSVARTGIKCLTIEDVKDCLNRCLDKELHRLRNLQIARDLK